MTPPETAVLITGPGEAVTAGGIGGIDVRDGALFLFGHPPAEGQQAPLFLVRAPGQWHELRFVPVAASDPGRRMIPVPQGAVPQATPGDG